uniref:receptor protein-tyrosine kinase n=2 Tax=Clytia hemisphaerica TaxID=252671 RepID=A0A7M5XCJ5_9CNID
MILKKRKISLVFICLFIANQCTQQGKTSQRGKKKRTGLQIRKRSNNSSDYVLTCINAPKQRESAKRKTICEKRISIQWYKDTKEWGIERYFKATGRLYKHNDNQRKLILIGIREADSGTYHCVPFDHPSLVNSVDIPPKAAPQIHSYLPRIRIKKINEFTKFSCVTSSKYARSWGWFINGKKVDQDDRQNFKVVKFNYLRIQKIPYEYDGLNKVECVVTNDFGTSTMNYTLIVEGQYTKPKFVKVRERPIFDLGLEGHTMDCRAFGKRPVNITWYHDGVDIRRKYRTGYQYFFLDDDHQRLTINNAHYTDSGIYKCVLKNKYGSISRQSTFRWPGPHITFTHLDGRAPGIKLISATIGEELVMETTFSDFDLTTNFRLELFKLVSTTHQKASELAWNASSIIDLEDNHLPSDVHGTPNFVDDQGVVMENMNRFVKYMVGSINNRGTSKKVKMVMKNITKHSFGDYMLMVSTQYSYDVFNFTIVQDSPAGEDNSIEIAVGVTIPILIVVAIGSYVYFKSRHRYLKPRRRSDIMPIVRQDSDASFESVAVRRIRQSFYDEHIDSNWEIEPSKLTKHESIGAGNFGDVFRGQLEDLNGNLTTVAIKTVKGSASDGDINNFFKEIEIMKRVDGRDHPNVLAFYGVCTRNLFAVLEYCSNGNLRDYLRSKRPSEENKDIGLDRTEMLTIYSQICDGLCFLASKNIIHRDIAARNVLVTSDFTMKIADFGLARSLNKDYYQMRSTGEMPILWMAIESITKGLFTVKSDVWSFAILMWEVETLGGRPYTGISVQLLSSFLTSGRRLHKPHWTPEKIYTVMLMCWEEEPSRRPSFEDLQMIFDSIANTTSTTSSSSYTALVHRQFHSDILEIIPNHLAVEGLRQSKSNHYNTL